MKRFISDYIKISFKGIAMGAADVVPGVSGGTIAFISGIYDELLGSINKINLNAIKVLRKDGFKAVWKHINGNFLLALFIGIGISIVSLANVLTHLMQTEPVLLWSFFFGLILASILLVGKTVQKWSIGPIIGILIGTSASYYITTLSGINSDGQSWYLFLCGMIAICAMILPGISGSFILLLLGAYEPIMSAIAEKEITTILIVAAGCVTGLLSFSRGLHWLLKKHTNITIAILTGFLIGSLNKIWPWKITQEVFVKHAGTIKEKFVPLVEENVLPSTFSESAITEAERLLHITDKVPQTGLSLGLMVVGFATIVAVEKLGSKKN